MITTNKKCVCYCTGSRCWKCCYV